MITSKHFISQSIPSDKLTLGTFLDRLFIKQTLLKFFANQVNDNKTLTGAVILFETLFETVILFAKKYKKMKGMSQMTIYAVRDILVEGTHLFNYHRAIQGVANTPPVISEPA